MSGTLAIVLNTLLVTVEYTMLYVLTTSFFRKKRADSFVNLGFIICFLIGLVMLFFAGDRLIIKYPLTIVIFTLWIYLCFNADVLKAFFVAVLWMGYILLNESLGFSIASSALKISKQELMNNPYSYYLFCFSVKTVGVLGLVIIHVWLKQHFDKNVSAWHEWLRVLFIPLASLVVAICLLKIYWQAPALSPLLLGCSVTVLLMDMMSIILLDYLEKKDIELRDSVILRHKMKAELDNVAAWKEAYAGQRKLTHDFNNQLIAIQGMVEQNAPKDEVMHYLERLQNVEIPTALLVSTRRIAVDVILNQKLSIAKNKDINFKTQLDDLSVVPLPDDALVTVLSNLIDNAIEACEKITDANGRFIYLKMRVMDGVTFLYIENSTAEPVIIRNNKVVINKRNTMEHGYGLQNVASVMDNYNAIYSLNYRQEDSVFSFSAQISPE